MSTEVVLTPGLTARRPPRLQLLAAAHDGAAARPRGVHLRWFGPRSLPRPAVCTLHRLDDAAWTALTLSLRRSVLTADAGTGSLRWSGRERAVRLDDDVLLVTPVPAVPDGAVLVRFAEPVLVVDVVFDGPPPAAASPLRAFHRSHLLAVVPAAPRVQIEGPGITEVLVPAPIRGLSWVPEHLVVTALADRTGADTVASPLDVDAAYALVAAELAAGPIRNRFVEAADLAAFRNRYGPDQVRRLVASVGALRLDPAATVHRAAQHGLAPADLRVAPLVDLACLDPNVARLAGGYWVDHAADPDRVWRHVAVATFKRGDTKSVSGFARSDGPAPLPVLDTPEAVQLPGFRYVEGQPLARVGLRRRAGGSTAPLGTGPVLVDVTRIQDGTPENLTADRPHLVTAATDQLFEDPDRPLDVELVYVCRPIDLFGRHGTERRTKPIHLEDTSAPPPPTGLTLRIDQDGHPWSDPADLVGDLRGGRVTVTFHFGEAQWCLAPDARLVRVRWTDRPGEGTADLDSWAELATVELRAPVRGTVPIDAAHPLAPIALAVAEVRSVADGAPAAGLPPAAAPQDRAELAGDRPRVELLVGRALLAPGLFDGHRCRLGGVTATVAASTAGLAHADDPTPDKRLTARLILDGATPIPVAGTAQLDLPELDGLSTIALRAALRDGTFDDGAATLAELVLEGPLPDLPAGGELAIDVRSRIATTDAGTASWEPLVADSPDGTVDPLLARIVAEPVEDGGRTRHLVRMRPTDLLRLLLAQRRAPGSRPVRHHAPYVVGPLDLGVGTDAPVRIDLADGQRFARVRVTAFVEDRGALQGPPAPAVEGRVLRPPPPPLAPPYPRRAGHEAVRGTATPPDARRRSRVELGWDRSTDPAARYDVSRALDSALIALDRSLWAQGGSLPHHRRHPVTLTSRADLADGVRLGLAGPGLPDPTGAVVEARDGRATVRSAELDGAGWRVFCAAAEVAGWQDGDAAVVHLLGVVTAEPVRTRATGATVLDNGLVRIDLDADAAEPLVVCAGGRLVVRHAAPDGGESVDVAYGLQTVRVHDGSVYALARPTRASDTIGALVPGPAEATPPPDHSAVLADDAALRRLAQVRDAAGRPALDAAFGVVTGVPLTAAQAETFDDAVPGPGRSRFLYRVRAVGAGHAASAWSDPSVAFHQFPPAPPVLTEVRCAVAGEHAVLSWRRPDRAVDGVEVALVRPDGHCTPLPAALVTAEPRYAVPPVVLFDPPVPLSGGGPVAVRLRAADGSLTDLHGRVFGRAANGDTPATASGLRYEDPPVLAGTVEVLADDIVIRSQPATRTDRNAVVLALTDLTTPTVEIAPFVRHEDTVLRARPVEVAIRG
jgi:hypothetical protein